MTVKVTNGLGSNVIVNNTPPTETIKAHNMTGATPAVKVVAQNTDTKAESHLSFERKEATIPGSAPTESVLVEAAPTTEVSEVEKPATSAERRDAMKRANAEHAKAIQMQKEAKDLMAKAQQFQEVAKRAATNPVELAKAIGMDPTEFLRRYQNEMFNIPNEEPKKPEPTVDDRLKQYEEERSRERRAAADYQSEMIRLNYIQTKILPTIKADPEKFQLLNYNNLEKSANYIYDMMNAHFQTTGEEWNAADVAEEMENQLQAEFEEKIAQVKKIGKFSKHFQAEAEEAKEEVSTVSSQLGSKKEWNGAKSPVPTPGRLGLDKNARRERLKKL